MTLELWAICGCAAFFAFLTSTIFGIGSALILSPVLMFAFPAGEAVAMMAPIMVVNNILKAGVFRRDIHWAPAGIALIGALPLAALGAYCVPFVNAEVIRASIAGVIFFAVLGPRVMSKLNGLTTIESSKPEKTSPRARVALLLMGGLSGFLSGVCSSGGPAAAVGFKGVGLVKEGFVGTIAVFAIGMQLAKIPVYLSSNILRADHALVVVGLGAIALLSVFVGRGVVSKFNAQQYRIAIDMMLLVVGLMLLLKVFFS